MLPCVCPWIVENLLKVIHILKGLQQAEHLRTLNMYRLVSHHEYAPPVQTINKEHYLSFLHRLRDAKWQKLLQLWAAADWQLHHDNTPAHASHLVQSFLMKHQITRVTQPPYSPDLAPCNFWLFPKLKSPLQVKRFQTVMRLRKLWWGSWWWFQQRILQCFEQWKRL